MSRKIDFEEIEATRQLYNRYSFVECNILESKIKSINQEIERLSHLEGQAISEVIKDVLNQSRLVNIESDQIHRKNITADIARKKLELNIVTNLLEEKGCSESYHQP